MNFRSKLVAVVGSALLLASSITSGAAQTTADAKVEITSMDGAGLSVSIIDGEDFGTIQYSYQNTTVVGSLELKAVDSRGTGAGWNVTLSATDFIRDANTKFSVTNATLTPGTLAIVTQPTSTDQTAGMTTSSFTGTTTKIWTADELSGAGEFTLGLDADLNVPAGTLVGTYTSEVEVSIQTGP